MKKLALIITVILFAGGISFAQNKIGIEIGNKAPEIIGKSPDGKQLKLSDTRGKLVLIDFWAAWCPPCRRENPNLVNTYNLYKDKKFQNGETFTVFGVSLDKTASAWKKAIKDDKLSWPYHVSELKHWDTKYVPIYGIRGIPHSVLIDGDGIILAKGLRGPSLEAALKKYLK